MNPEGTITINRIPVYFSDSEIKVEDTRSQIDY